MPYNTEYIKQCFIVGAMFLIMSSCSADKEGSVTDVVSRWNGREIVFPENSIFTIQGKDIVDFQFHDAEFKILCYVDEKGYMPFLKQLGLWNHYIMGLNATMGRLVPVIFYVNANDTDELNMVLQHEDFRYPLCIDQSGELNRINHFPTQIDFQTFLLDKANRVVGIGNPIRNINVEKVYYDIMSNRERESLITRISTEISVDATEIDFGQIPIGVEQTQTITISNIGQNPLVIEKTSTSCGCTIVENSKEPIAPNQKTEVTIKYNPDKKGFFSKTVTIYCNTGKMPLQIRVKGNVI